MSRCRSWTLRYVAQMKRATALRGLLQYVYICMYVCMYVCMREGRKFPKNVWKAFEKTFAADNDGTLDARHAVPKFRQGFWMSMYWETLSRQIPQRAQRDAKALGVPLVFLQAIDECNSIDADAARRLLEVPNMHNTGHIHGDTSC